MSYLTSILSTDNTFNLVVFLFLASAKLSILLGFIYLTCRSFQWLSAANKHLIWLTGLGAGLLFPLLLTINNLEIPILPNQTSLISQKIQSNDSAHIEGNEQESSNLMISVAPPENSMESSLILTADEAIKQESSSAPDKIIGGIIVIWLFGITILSFRLAFGVITTNRLSRQGTIVINPVLTMLAAELSQDIKLKEEAKLFISKDISMPVVCGLWRSKVLLPENFETWSEERQRVVLLHELAHIKRRDCLTQLLAQIVCIFFWFNPFVWYVARHLRILRELACDDYVLNAGTKPSVYAGHLLDITKLLRNKSFFDSSSTATVAISGKSQIETRLSAILNSRQSRWGANSYMKICVIFIVAIFALPLSALQLKSQKNRLSPSTEAIIANQQEPENRDLQKNEGRLTANRQINSPQSFQPVVRKKAQFSTSNRENENFEKTIKAQADTSKAQSPPANRQENLTTSENQTRPSLGKLKNKLNSLSRLATPLGRLQNNLGSLKGLNTSLKLTEN